MRWRRRWHARRRRAAAPHRRRLDALARLLERIHAGAGAERVVWMPVRGYYGAFGGQRYEP